MLGLVKTWEKQWKQRVPTKTQTETNTKSKGQEKKVTTARAQRTTKKNGRYTKMEKGRGSKDAGAQEGTEEEAESWCNSWKRCPERSTDHQEPDGNNTRAK